MGDSGRESAKGGGAMVSMDGRQAARHAPTYAHTRTLTHARLAARLNGTAITAATELTAADERHVQAHLLDKDRQRVAVDAGDDAAADVGSGACAPALLGEAHEWQRGGRAAG